MTFVSENQRRWYFANKGKTGKFIPGDDPVKLLYKQDDEELEMVAEEAEKEIRKDRKDRKEIDNIEKKEHLKTQQIYSKDDASGRIYTLEREKLHNEIINTIDNKEAYFKDSAKQPEVIFIGGLPGAGKSSVIKKMIKNIKEGSNLKDYEKYKDYVYLNSDDIKEKLPEYNGYNAPLVQEESSDIYEKAIKKFSAQKKNLILDATLKSYMPAKEKVDKFKAQGYKTILLGVNVKGKTAINRAVARFKTSKRYVPVNYIKNNAEKGNKSILELRHSVDKYKIYNNDVDMVTGAVPQLIESTDSIKGDRTADAKTLVDNEADWRLLGTEKSDLEGYDTEKHIKVKKPEES